LIIIEGNKCGTDKNMKILLVVIYRRGYFNKFSSSFSSTFK